MEVVPNQIAELLPLRSFPAATSPSTERPLVIGWGGSFGHRENLRAIAPPLIAWLPLQMRPLGSNKAQPVRVPRSSASKACRPGVAAGVQGACSGSLSRAAELFIRRRAA